MCPLRITRDVTKLKWEYKVRNMLKGVVNPFRTLVSFWGQTTYNLSDLSPTYGTALLKGLSHG